jgi:hypothetical protein
MSLVTRFKRSIISCLALAGLTISTSASAIPVSANLIIDTNSGLLQGARNVTVQGFAYDVEFVYGTCADIFAGCDHPLDFAFFDLSSVVAAGQALLDQVFLDGHGYLFDSHAGTMVGCDWSDSSRPPTNTICFINTPFSRFPIGSNERALYYHYAVNAGSEHLDGDGVLGGNNGGGTRLDPPTNTDQAGVWARWTQPTSVPEPSTLALFACAIVAIGMTRRSRRDGSALS